MRMPSMRLGVAGARAFTVEYESNHRQCYLSWMAFGKYIEDLPDELGKSLSEKMLDKAVEFSSGGRTAAELATYKPGLYSVKRPATPEDYLINVQTGRFRSGWRVARTRHGSRLTPATFRIANSTRVGRWNLAMLMFMGTKRMRRRPLPEKLRETAGPEIRRMLHAARMRIYRRAKRGRPRMRKAA